MFCAGTNPAQQVKPSSQQRRAPAVIGTHHYHVRLLPFSDGARQIRFSFTRWFQSGLLAASREGFVDSTKVDLTDRAASFFCFGVEPERRQLQTANNNQARG